MRRQRSRSLALALAVLGGGALLAACLPPAPPPPPPVLVTTTTTVDPPLVDDGSIMGPSQLTAAQIAAYVCNVGHCPATPATAQSWKPEITPTQMAQLYIDEGNLVGVRGDVAFCQSVLETGWFAWSELVRPPQRSAGAPDDPNFAIGRASRCRAITTTRASARSAGAHVFMRQATAQLGVRAQLQHLRNYADSTSTPDNLGAPFVPRPGYTTTNYNTFVYKGKAPNWVDLDGKWAVPGTTYGQTILQICNEHADDRGTRADRDPAAAVRPRRPVGLVPFDPSTVTYRY